MAQMPAAASPIEKIVAWVPDLGVAQTPLDD